MNKFNKFKVEISDIEWFDPEELLPKVNKSMGISENILLVSSYRNQFFVFEGWYSKQYNKFMDICSDEIDIDVCAWAYKPKVKRV